MVFSWHPGLILAILLFGPRSKCIFVFGGNFCVVVVVYSQLLTVRSYNKSSWRRLHSCSQFFGGVINSFRRKLYVCTQTHIKYILFMHHPPHHSKFTDQTTTTTTTTTPTAIASRFASTRGHQNHVLVLIIITISVHKLRNLFR